MKKAQWTKLHKMFQAHLFLSSYHISKTLVVEMQYRVSNRFQLLFYVVLIVNSPGLSIQWFWTPLGHHVGDNPIRKIIQFPGGLNMWRSGLCVLVQVFSHSFFVD